MSKIIEDIMDTYDCDREIAKEIYKINRELILEVLDQKLRTTKRRERIGKVGVL